MCTRYIHLGNQWVPGSGGAGTCTNKGLFYWWPLEFEPESSAIKPRNRFEDEVTFTIET